MKKGSIQLKTCPRCGTQFECRHSSDCWCMHVRLQPRALEVISNTYSDCLCRSCLQHFANQKEN